MNQLQYGIAKVWLKRFTRDLEIAEARQGVDSILKKLETDALRSKLIELRQQIIDYEHTVLCCCRTRYDEA